MEIKKGRTAKQKKHIRKKKIKLFSLLQHLWPGDWQKHLEKLNASISATRRWQVLLVVLYIIINVFLFFYLISPHNTQTHMFVLTFLV
jgi:hypothetical protein